MTRYTDRDCYAALIRVAAALNANRTSDSETWCVEVPSLGRRAGLQAIVDLANALKVELMPWNDPRQTEGHRRLVLDHAPGCYGGGVRAGYCKGTNTGQHTPAWWLPSAGLGPGAVPRKEFCHIVGAVERALS